MPIKVGALNGPCPRAARPVRRLHQPGLQPQVEMRSDTCSSDGRWQAGQRPTAWSHSGHTTCASTVSWPEGSLLACAVTCDSCPCPSDVLSRALFVLFSVHRSALVLILAQAAPGRLGGAHPILCLHDTCGCTEVQSHGPPPRAHCHPRPGAVSCVELSDRCFQKVQCLLFQVFTRRGVVLCPASDSVFPLCHC